MHNNGELTDRTIAIRKQKQYDLEGSSEEVEIDPSVQSQEHKHGLGKIILNRNPVLLDISHLDEDSKTSGLLTPVQNDRIDRFGREDCGAANKDQTDIFSAEVIADRSVPEDKAFEKFAADVDGSES